MQVKCWWLVVQSLSFVELLRHGLQPARFLCPWNFPGKNATVGCHFLLQGIFLTLGLNLGLQHCRQILQHLSHKGSPHVAANGIIAFFLWLNSIPLYICTTSLSIHLSMDIQVVSMFWLFSFFSFYYICEMIDVS